MNADFKDLLGVNSEATIEFRRISPFFVIRVVEKLGQRQTDL